MTDRYLRFTLGQNPDWAVWIVTVDFELYGIKGREVYTLEAPDEKVAEARGYGNWEFECIDRDLIGTWDCGCCARFGEENARTEISAMEIIR
jgi:hypothetical protein